MSKGQGGEDKIHIVPDAGALIATWPLCLYNKPMSNRLLWFYPYI